MDLLRSEKLEKAVRLRGVIDAKTAFDEADVYVASSLIPQNDPTIYLAAARGLPIVTYQSGSPAADAQLESAGCAVVVPRGENDLLSQALLDLARDRTKLVRMSKQAIEFATANTIDRVHEQRAELAMKCVKEAVFARS
jgi:glycosyltransferase involved in cell wall biosynthesis